MKPIITIFILLLAATATFAQAPAIQWEKSLGGSGNDVAQSIQQTSDHGYIVAGSSGSDDGDVTGHHYDGDAWTIKLDSGGKLQWERSYGGNQWDEARTIRCTMDGGYIFVGKSFSTDGDVTGHHGTTQYADVWVVKLNAVGDIEWENSYGGTYADDGIDIQQTYDGGYIVAATTTSNDGDVTGYHGNSFNDYWILKLNSTGGIEWENCYGGTRHEIPCSVLQLQGGAYVVTGLSFSDDGDVTDHHGSKYSSDVWMIKLNSEGKLLEEQSLPNYLIQTPTGVCFSNTRGYIIAGVSESYPTHGIYQHGLGDMMIMKVSRRAILDTVCLFGGSQEDNAYAITQAGDGGYLAVGQTWSSDGDVTDHHCGGSSFCFSADYWVVKVDSSLKLQWKETLGGVNNDIAYAVSQTSDGGYIIAGQSDSYDGEVTGNHGLSDFWVVKLAPDHTAAVFASTAPSNATNKNLLLYPNPSSNQVNLSFPFSNNIITISDLFGRELKQWKMESGELKMVDVSFLQQGVYVVEIKDEKGNLLATQKLFKQ